MCKGAVFSRRATRKHESSFYSLLNTRDLSLLYGPKYENGEWELGQTEIRRDE
jgi:hypothetical protein